MVDKVPTFRRTKETISLRALANQTGSPVHGETVQVCGGVYQPEYENGKFLHYRFYKDVEWDSEEEDA